MADISTLKKLANEYGTPTYVFDEGMLKKRMREVKDIVGDDVTLCYSIKANPFLIPAMLDVTKRLEVCSPGELDICEALGVSGDRIVYSGVCKTKENILDAVTYEGDRQDGDLQNKGCYVYTAESILHVMLLDEVGGETGRKIPVLLRLNAGSQFGMSKEDLFFVIEKREEYSNIEIVGIHYFAGTQRKKLQQQKDELLMLKSLFDEIEEKYGMRPKHLEYGPGLPYPYFESDDFEDTLGPLKEIADSLKETATWCELTVEMGRFFASECGYYLTKVMDLKKNDKINYAIIDGGMNHVTYLGQVMGMKSPVITHIKADGSDEEYSEKDKAVFDGIGAKDYALCGSLCTTADVLVRQKSFENLQINDILAFSNIGAYSVTEGIYLFLSRTMPRILLLKENGDAVLARDFLGTSVLNTIKEYIFERGT